MKYQNTLKQCLMYIAAEFPDSILDTTDYATTLGIAPQKGVSYLEALQGLAVQTPDLLEQVSVLVVLPSYEEIQGTISLARASEALFLFRDAFTTPNTSNKKLIHFLLDNYDISCN
jgi:hypothetical protein